ncbi:hypothetical protein [Brachyspira catarrhinii]|uniref:Uncharacterized protein n=1 Tax=Brachyspira catarrhinii TaxID=2528966 RepID=A0ABY2TNC6_9SPIR|nr:hypothetical protein [Brachyspira catarrhinii]TKZ29733.1 hypothetical protein EZH24_10855 [Brachyspira catarrhinii]
MLIVIDRIDSLKIMKDRLKFLEKEYEKTNDFKLLYEIKTCKQIIKRDALALVEELEQEKYYNKK